MKFILNFFLFGIIFFLISIYFPEAFQTLVSWAQNSYDFVYTGIQTIIEKLSPSKGSPESASFRYIALLPIY